MFLYCYLSEIIKKKIHKITKKCTSKINLKNGCNGHAFFSNNINFIISKNNNIYKLKILENNIFYFFIISNLIFIIIKYQGFILLFF